MKNGIRPDPNKVHPIKGYDKEIYIKPTINNPRSKCRHSPPRSHW